MHSVSISRRKKEHSQKVDDTDLSLSLSLFLSPSITSYTCFLLTRLSYGARKHTDTDAITAGQREVIPSVYFTSVALGFPNPSNIEWNRFSVNYEFASCPSGRRFAKRRIHSTLSARLLFRRSRNWLPLRWVSAHFNRYFPYPAKVRDPRKSRKRVFRAERSETDINAIYYVGKTN